MTVQRVQLPRIMAILATLFFLLLGGLALVVGVSALQRDIAAFNQITTLQREGVAVQADVIEIERLYDANADRTQYFAAYEYEAVTPEGETVRLTNRERIRDALFLQIADATTLAVRYDRADPQVAVLEQQTPPIDGIIINLLCAFPVGIGSLALSGAFLVQQVLRR
ncbi:MAG: DUF3592 domain-containing protein [Chloroflexi bacterium]|nr:DUF3592 domain-containing protein [Chloroflexota bacterium]